jgi:hypothetical protein
MYKRFYMLCCSPALGSWFFFSFAVLPNTFFIKSNSRPKAVLLIEYHSATFFFISAEIVNNI